MNTYVGGGVSAGPHNHLTSVAPGLGSTAWATSQTLSGSDYTVYQYSGGANGEGTWTLESGVACQQISSSSRLVVARNHNGTSFALDGSNWYALDIPTTDSHYTGYTPGYTGQANWIAATPVAAGQAYAYIIENTAWTSGSSDDVIMELVQSNSTTNNVWLQIPGGATFVSVSPGTGQPWIVNHDGFGLYSGGYPQ